MIKLPNDSADLLNDKILKEIGSNNVQREIVFNSLKTRRLLIIKFIAVGRVLCTGNENVLFCLCIKA